MMRGPLVKLLLTGFLLVSLGCGGGEKPAASPDPNSTAPNTTEGTTNGGTTATAENGSGTPSPTQVPSLMPQITNGGTTTPAGNGSPTTAGPMAGDVSKFIVHAPDDTAIVIIRPVQALNNPVVKGLIQEWEAANDSFKLSDELAKFKKEVGISPEDVDYLVASVPQKLATSFGQMDRRQDDEPKIATAAIDPDSGVEGLAVEPESDGGIEPDAWEPPPMPTMLIRLKAPVDPEAMIAAKEAQLKALAVRRFDFGVEVTGLDPNDPYFERKKAYEEEMRIERELRSKITRNTYKDRTLIQAGKGPEWVCFLDNQTILVGTEAGLQGAIDRQGETASSPLIAQITPLADRDFAAVVDLTPVKSFLALINEQAPFPAKMVLGPVMQSKGITLSADLQGNNLIELQVIAESDESANNLQSILGSIIKSQLDQVKQMKDQAVDAGQVPPNYLPLLPIANSLIDGVTTSVSGDVVSVVVGRPKELQDLPTLAKPVFAEIVEKQRKAEALYVLHDIVIAAMNFEGINKQYPGNNQGNHPDDAKGLSWRVHLLPYLNAKDLYDEFHLNEPWDSDHNKTLISRMPRVFGTHPEGKTSIHVFVDNGAFFSGEGKERKIRNLVDGMSYTIMVVRAGDDVADVWTKPGGLTFNRENPIAALGNIGETFDVGLFDGKVRQLPKSIAAKTLRDLIDHKDGNPVDMP
ncbi:MAG: DUF1559 domain-containing protein [Planctomycetaceae bacterium]